MIRVQLVAPTRLYREGLRRSLDRESGIEVTATSPDVATAAEQCGELTPDVVLLDYATPGSLAFVRRVAARPGRVKVLVLGVSDSEEEVIECAESGVAGYVFRDDSIEELLSALRCAARSELRCSRKVAATLLRRLGSIAAARAPREYPLTRRELQILQLLDRGLSNKEIAGRLYIAVSTVKNHVHNILAKLDVKSRSHAAAVGRALGLVDPFRGETPASAAERAGSGRSRRPRGVAARLAPSASLDR